MVNMCGAGAVKSEKFNPRVLYLFGTYTIGKERLFLEVARTLGQKVYVSKEKMQVCQRGNGAGQQPGRTDTDHLHARALLKTNCLRCLCAGSGCR